jgi:hypothetical protein
MQVLDLGEKSTENFQVVLLWHSYKLNSLHEGKKHIVLWANTYAYSINWLIANKL